MKVHGLGNNGQSAYAQSQQPLQRAVAEVDLWDRAKRIAEAVQKHMSPPGELGVSALLEARRLKYGIPDEAFRQHALYDWVLVHQIPPEWDEDSDGKFAGTSIYKTENAKKRETFESSRGVIVSAGLGALDHMRSNGIDVGHIVSFVKIAPWARPTGYFDGYEYQLLILRDGDLITSEDLQEAIKKGECRITYDEQSKQHLFVDKDGKHWVPKEPYFDPSY